MNITPEQANLVRQWFDSLQDIHPEYLEQKDYELAVELYKFIGTELPSSILRNLSALEKVG